ncbi:phosphoribosylamine--glycine ligase [Candidatus Pelagibacter sp. Uisw_099_02]|uniref:phosphoribosylamine--glycine ligase n=1 Tax=Candidatus Pelagibacter sp. Uisw_099_02 TaxID=3230981 RepID=UPI0039E7665F|tara:strand:+ start:124 stop:1389 length:1266 start_codon:yes stop_codon:yes gene_type:complete
MKVGIIGSGGREHAICHALNKSDIVKDVFCFPGNAGTATIAKNIDLNLEDFDKLKDFIISSKIDLIIVGPEKPLVNGIVDFLKDNNIKVFGPNKLASQLEGSKIFTKKLCQKYNIPTANFGIFTKSHEANEFIKKSKYPLVIKADGLASGKGVYICKTQGDALTAIKEIFDGKFGKAENLLVEEFLEGEEMSYFVISDGNTIKNFETAQDHKQALEGDLGKNTGGMGAYSPSRLMNKEIEKKILDKIIKPTIRGLKQAGINYVGFLYAGLMIVKNEPFLIEYNVRMGDPECQVILPKLETDILNIFLACCDGKLDELKIKWHDKKSLCIVLCARGYPDEYKKNILIENLDKIKITNREYIYHAGTINVENKIYSIGGRVLNFVCLSENFLDARIKILDTIKFLNWDNGFYRKDIGYKVIDK